MLKNIPADTEIIALVTKEDTLQVKRELQTLKNLKEKHYEKILLSSCFEHEIEAIERILELLKIKLPEDGNPQREQK